MPAPTMQTSTCTFSASGGHSARFAVADQMDSWRGMGVFSQVIEATPCKKRSRGLVRSVLLPPARELRLDCRGAVDLRQRALFLRLLLLFPLGDQRVCLGERLPEGVAGRQRLLEEGAAEVGEVVLVGAAEGGAVVARGRDDEGRVVLQRIDEAAGIAGRDDDHLPADAALLDEARELHRRQVAQRQVALLQRQGVAAAAVAREEEKQDVL